jgi:hypothetical protein
MHCRACDALLSDFEATRKNANTFQFLDLCNYCYNEVKEIIPTIDRKDLMTARDVDVLDFPYYEDYYDILELKSYDLKDN